MANALSDYMEAQFLGWLRGVAVAAAPATVYFGLLTVLPGDTGTSAAPADGTEATGTGYARVALTTASGWSAVSVNGTIQHMTSAAAVTFPQAGGAWGTIVGWGIWDAASAGHLLFYGTCTSVAITSGMTPSFTPDVGMD